MKREMFSDVERYMEIGKWIAASLAAFLTGIPELTYFLLWLMAIDTVFGVLAARKRKDLSPTDMWEGATKKLGSLGVVALAAIVDNYIDIPGIDLVQATTIFYIGPELLSILRNAAIAGVPIPPQFTTVLRYFQDKEEKVENPTVPKI